MYWHIFGGSKYSRTAATKKRPSSTKHLTWATNNVPYDVAAAFAAFATEEATEYRQEAVLRRSSTTEAVGFPVFVAFLLLAIGGWPCDVHLHRTPGLLNGRGVLCLVLHV